MLQKGEHLPVDVEYGIRSLAVPYWKRELSSDDSTAAHKLELRRIAAGAYECFLKAHPDRDRVAGLASRFRGPAANTRRVEFMETAALYYHVRDRITYVTGPGDQCATETEYVRGGQCLEHAQLLVDLLRVLNIEAYCLGSQKIQHALVGVALNSIPSSFASSTIERERKHVLLLDPTCKSCTFGEIPAVVKKATEDLSILREPDKPSVQAFISRSNE
jgi:hypothetical protein